MLREALTNINKHAHASAVSIRLFESGEVVYLVVTDDGVGFDPGELHGGLGLGGMHDRLQLLGNKLEVESRPGGPTKVTAAVRRWRPT